MLVQRHISKQKQAVLVVAIICINVVVGFLVYRNFVPKRRYAKDATESSNVTLPQVSENIAAIETLTQDFSRALLDSEEFRSLEKHGSWPVGEAVTGRANPFLPAFGP